MADVLHLSIDGDKLIRILAENKRISTVDAENARLRAIVHVISEHPPVYETGMGDIECHYCFYSETKPGNIKGHELHCAYVRACQEMGVEP